LPRDPEGESSLRLGHRLQWVIECLGRLSQCIYAT
jgi:hypothetical protein